MPMGQTLAYGPESGAPRFFVWATKDPNSGNLDRIQVIKGWIEDGKSQERIYNVALSDERVTALDGSAPPVGNTVDVKQASYTNDIGDVQFSAPWEDPDFDSSTSAFYYVRVLEIPTPRWTTHVAVARDVEPPEGVPASLQERAYTSPIWYEP